MQPSTSIADSSPSVLRRYDACLGCRKRKLKCDGRRPSCRRCVDSSQECQYQHFMFRSKARLLQDRIRELEAQIQDIEQQQKSSPVSVHSTNRSYSDPFSEISFWSLTGSPSGGGSIIELSADSFLDMNSFLPSCPSPTLGLGLAVHPYSVRLNPAPEAIQTLLEIFMLRKSHSGFELHIGRVLQGLQPGTADPVAPALLYAMLLTACSFAQEPGLKAWESRFLELTKWEIETNIVRAHGVGEGKYNRLHHLQAMIMLGQYFFFKCRLLEAHVHISQATRFAVALGIHQLDSRNFHSFFSEKKSGRAFGVERWRPRDQMELGEAINVWWACAARDLGGSIVNGLPPSVSLDEVTTVWPRPLSDFENSHDLPSDNYSVASLLDPNFSHLVADVSQDSVISIQSKGCILLYTAGKLDTERTSNPQVTNDWWAKFEEYDRTIQRFLQTTPLPYMGRNVEEVADLVQVHAAIECSVIQLHSALAEYELASDIQEDTWHLQSETSLGRHSYKRCIGASQNIATATLQLEGVHMSYVHMFTGVNWMCATQVLVQHISRLRESGQIEQAQEVEQQVIAMERAMDRLVVEYPVIRPQADQLRAIRTC